MLVFITLGVGWFLLTAVDKLGKAELERFAIQRESSVDHIFHDFLSQLNFSFSFVSTSPQFRHAVTIGNLDTTLLEMERFYEVDTGFIVDIFFISRGDDKIWADLSSAIVAPEPLLEEISSYISRNNGWQLFTSRHNNGGGSYLIYSHPISLTDSAGNNIETTVYIGHPVNNKSSLLKRMHQMSNASCSITLINNQTLVRLGEDCDSYEDQLLDVPSDGIVERDGAILSKHDPSSFVGFDKLEYAYAAKSLKAGQVLYDQGYDIFIIVFVLFGANLILFLIGRQVISRSVSTLVEYASEVTSNTEKEAPISPITEFNTISEAIGVMVNSLQNEYRVRNKAEIEVRRLNRDLEHRVRQRTNELVKANHSYQMAKEEAEAASEAKGSFLANMSHELRTPLNAVTGMSHLISQTALSKKQRNYVDQILAASRSLLNLINDILDFSKIEAGKLEIENISFELEDTLREISNIISHKAREKGIEFLISISSEVPPQLIGDPHRLEQILVNLGTNAVKFTTEGEVLIQVECESLGFNSTVVKFTVSDTGIGMNQQQKSRLFQAFTQADSSVSRRFGGTGLGLVISESLIHLMGGGIGFDSIEGEGSIFYFSLKFGFKPGAALAGKRIPEALNKLNTLVIDSSKTSQGIFQKIFEQFSWKCDLADDNEAAHEVITRALNLGKPYDLVLVDWREPGGIKARNLIDQICRQYAHHEPPQFIVTSIYNKEQVTIARSLKHVDAILVKPVTPSILFDSMVEIFANEPVTVNHNLPSNKLGTSFSFTGARVLLVDDNRVNQQVAQELLEIVGFSVTLADDGKQALNALENSNFDAVLMDIQMPVMDGYTATKTIREKPGYESLPIIGLTANATLIDREKCLKSGMNDHVSKPIDPKILFNALAKQITIVPDKTINVLSGSDEKQTSEILLSNLPGLDIADGLHRFLGQPDAYLRVLRKFKLNQANTSIKLTAAFAAEDWEECRKILHTVKGVAGNISATNVKSAAEIMERELIEGNELEAKQHLPKILRNLEIVLSGLEALDEDAPEQATSSIFDPIIVLNIFDELQLKLQSYDMDIDEHLESVTEHLFGNNFDDAIRSLTKHLQDYNFESALECLTRLRSQIDAEVRV